MRERKINYLVILVLVLGIFGFLLLIFFKLRSPSPFSHPLFSSSYQARIPSSNLNFSLGRSDSFAQVGIGRNNSSLELVMPLERSSLKRSGNQLVYSIPEKSIEAHYQLIDKGLKEEIVLMAKPKTNEFTSELKLKNLRLKITPEDIPVFFDSKTDDYQFHFQKPFAKDAQGKITEDVKLRLIPVYQESLSPLPTGLERNPHETKIKDKVTRKLLGEAKATEIQVEKYQLVLILNQDWLFSPQRVYPITIDPTVVHDTSSEFATGTLNRIKDSGSGSSPYLEDYHQELPTDINTVGLWHMNETSGSTVSDSSGNNNTGTATGTTIVNGKLNNARSFNGTSDYIAVTRTTVPSGLTYEAWVKTTSTDATASYPGNAALNVIGDHTGGVYNGFGVHGGKVRYNHYSSGWQTVDSATSVNNGNWHFIAVTHNQSTGAVVVYVDGRNDATGTITYNTTDTAFDTIGAGYSNGTGRGDFFNGTIDEVRISNRTRTPEEINADAQIRPYSVYTSDVIDLTTVTSWNSLSWTEQGVQTGDGETPNSSTSLTAQWNFNETSGTTANNDAEGTSCGGTPSNCDGTLTNFSYTSSQDQYPGTGWTANNKRWGAGGLMFDGSNDYVSVPDNNSLDITGDITLEAWVKMNKWGVTDTIIVKGRETNDTENYHLYLSEGKVAFQYNTGATWHRYQTNNAVVFLGNWHHIVSTYTFRAASSAKIYVDGNLVTGSWIGGTGNAAATTNNLTLTVGAVRAASRYANATIDSTRIYTRILTASEILSNYQSGNIEFQTRSSANNSTWEAWKPTTSESQIDSMDAPFDWATPSASIWSGVPIATSSSTFKIEGTGSLKTTFGAPKVDANTVALWHMEETSGTGAYIKDSTANANHGTPTGTTAVDGFYGKARSFNGTSDYIDVTWASSLSLPSTLTIEAWIKTSASCSPTTCILVEARGGAANNQYVLSIDNGKLNFDRYTPSGGNVQSTNSVNDGKWHHVAVTMNDSADQVVFYIDGVGETKSYTESYTGGTPTAFTIGATNQGSGRNWYFSGQMDEVRISNVTRTAEEIAEAYRAGRDHRLSRTLSSTDLSSKTKLPFYIAADRPGTYLEATIGESAYANYEPDANTCGLWHLEEDLGSSNTSAFLKDSSSYGANMDPGSSTAYPAFVQGKIGKARYFDGGDSATATITNPAYTNTLDVWIYPVSSAASKTIVTNLTTNASSQPVYGGCTGTVLTLNQWIHIAAVSSDSTHCYLYQNGVLTASGSTGVTYGTTVNAGATSFIGTIDEVRISNTARTADEIRQAYEIGKRTHPVTVDFATSGLSSNLLTGSGDYSFDVATTSGLFKYDQIIAKENYEGTEYLAQGEVSSINTTTRTVTVSSWDSGSTFPSGGYTANATFLKWQREMWDISGPLDAHINAASRITIRVTDGSQGASFWLDDIRSGGGYLTTPGGSTITSTAQRYFQYRAIFSTSDTAATSPALSSVTLDYNSNTAPTTPTIENNRYLDGATVNDTTPTFNFKSTDGEADDLEYEIQVDDDSNFGSLNLLAESSTSSGFLNTENGSDTHPFTQNQVISFTVQSGEALTNGTTYYYRLRARDPSGSNTWSSWSTARSLTIDTSALKEPFQCNLSEAAGGGGPLTLTWIDQTTDEDHYYIMRSLNSQVWTPWATPSANTTSYTDSSVSNGNTYQYRIRAETAAYEPDTPWCTSAILNLGTGDFTIEGMEIEGMEIR